MTSSQPPALPSRQVQRRFTRKLLKKMKAQTKADELKTRRRKGAARAKL